MKEKYSKCFEYIADSIETGYSSIFTFAVKELLNSEERREVSLIIRNLSVSHSPENFIPHSKTNRLI